MWQNIWQNKAQNLKGLDFNISNLMKIDGFDTSGESLTERAWIAFFSFVAEVAQIDSGDKAILEIGCGGGQH